MEDEEEVQVKQKTKAKSKSKSKSKKKSRNGDGQKAWEDVGTVLSVDQGFMDQEVQESNKLDHKRKHGDKNHKKSIEHIQTMAQNATLPAYPPPDEDTPDPPAPAPTPDDPDSDNEFTPSPNGSVAQEETAEEKDAKAKEAAKKEQELKEKREKEGAYTIARDQAIALQGEYQALQAKTTAMDVAAAKARAAAKQLRVAMGSGSDVEADLAAEELGIKTSDAAKIAGKTGNATNATKAGNSTNSTNSTAIAKGSGVSVVSFSVPTSEDADMLVSKLFKDQLIADVQIISGNTRRMFMRYKKMVETDNLVKLRLVTADVRVPALIRYLIQNNPNGSGDEVVPSIVSQQMNSGSIEYTSWVKNQTKQTFATENGEQLNDVINDLESAVASSKEMKPDDEEATMLEETAGDAKIEKKEEKP